MSADAGPDSVDAAWGQVPPGKIEAASRGTFTRRRIERIAAIAAGVGCFVLGVQAFVIALGDDAGVSTQWQPLTLTLVFGVLALMCVACFFPQTARPATGTFAVVYVVFLLVWPLLAFEEPPAATPEPWPWYLVNVATMAAVIAFPPVLQLLWTLAVPVLYGVVRLALGGFELDFWRAMIFEVPYSLILGVLLFTLALIFRRMATGVDRERSRTAALFAQAADAQAAQEERVTVSALMHDSVLAALIAAERADGPRARSLAVSMAREALEGLADTGGPSTRSDSQPATHRALARAIQAALADLGVRLEIDVVGDDDSTVPGEVAVAVTRAATQAVANSVQHADGRGLTARVGPHPGAGEGVPSVEVIVRDRGPGFDPGAVPADRLGISASIVARVAAVDGTADIASSQHGTIVTLRWKESRR